MSLRDVFRLAPTPAATPALTTVAGMLGLIDWNMKLNTLTEKLDTALAERDVLAAKRQALALTASEDATAEKELADVERKHAAADLTVERLQLAAVEAERHRADEAHAERERIRQATIKASTKDAEKFCKAVAEAQAATDMLEKALAKVTEAKHALMKSSGEYVRLGEIEMKILNSIKDQLSTVSGGFSRCEAIHHDKRGDARQYLFPVEYFIDAAVRNFDKS